jgi:hypothetical protein
MSATLPSVMNNSKPFQPGPFPVSPASSKRVERGFSAGLAQVSDIDRCPSCDIFLSGAYYLVNGHIACAVCAIQARARSKTHTVLIRCLVLAFWGFMIWLVWPFLQRQNLLREMAGLIIVSVGVRIIWQLTAGATLRLDGPYMFGVQSE